MTLHKTTFGINVEKDIYIFAIMENDMHIICGIMQQTICKHILLTWQNVPFAQLDRQIDNLFSKFNKNHKRS